MSFPLCLIGQMQNNGNMKMHSGSKMALYGNFSNEGNFNDNLGTFYVVGNSPQVFNGNNLIQTNNFVINKVSNSLQLENKLQISNILTFNKGLLVTDHANLGSDFVEFLDESSYSGASHESYINGVVRKVGNDAFVFPIGSDSLLRTIGMSSPSSTADHFTAYYKDDDPDGLYSRASLDVNLNHVSSCEYWVLDRTGGSSTVEVALSWDTSSCGVVDLCALQVSRWDGSKWVSEGNGGASGNSDSGTIVSGTMCSSPGPVGSFNPFTLGSTSINNPLPITLVSFEASVCATSVCLRWVTASELNNDFFTVEKSVDGINWKWVEDIKGAGNSQNELSYSTIDHSPFAGASYYRLKQTDFNGEYTYSSIEPVKFESAISKGLMIYPNPARDNVTITGLNEEIEKIRIFNTTGQELSHFVTNIESTKSSLKFNISMLNPGVYYIQVADSYRPFIKQ